MKLINSRDLKAKILDGTFLPDWCGVLVNRVIDSQPTIDAVPVVRCKDCEFFDGKYCEMIDCRRHLDDFCSYGKKEAKSMTKHIDRNRLYVARAVRCKDCKYFRRWSSSKGFLYRCSRFNCEILPDDFCNNGQRMDSGNKMNDDAMQMMGGATRNDVW